MRSRFRLKPLSICAAAAALGGCLVSEEPVLDASTGNATPIAPGDYIMCPLAEDEGEADCERFSVNYDGAGLYRFVDPDGEEEPVEMRFRRVARGGYAVQSGEDDGYMYYYGRKDADRFRLMLMMCDHLQDGLRWRLAKSDDLTPEDEDFTTCAVNTLKGLVDPAKAYHRGDVVGDDRLEIEFAPAPAAPSADE